MEKEVKPKKKMPFEKKLKIAKKYAEFLRQEIPEEFDFREARYDIESLADMINKSRN